MQLWIPPGTAVVQNGAVVALVFPREQDAVAFVQWLRWMDQQPGGTDMTILRPEEKAAKQ